MKPRAANPPAPIGGLTPREISKLQAYAAYLAQLEREGQRDSVGYRMVYSGSLCLNLGQRERQVIELLSEDLTVKEIGARLSISPRTVETYLARIYGKLRVHTRFGAVKFWREFRQAAYVSKNTDTTPA